MKRIRNGQILLCLWILLFMPTDIAAQEASRSEPEWLQPFKALYSQRWQESSVCSKHSQGHYRVCSPKLRNEGNAPFVLHHDQPTHKVMILLHGLSDSPYYYESIAPEIAKLGYTVIVGLLPAHGLQEPESAMLHKNLRQHWYEHTRELVDFAHSIGKDVSIGGFSTGGALAVHYSLQNPERIAQLVLFSGALALPKPVEWLAKVPGAGGLLSWLDKGYASNGPNPYKYPEVSKYSALVLMRMIFDIRELIDNGQRLNLPLFAAHSRADTTTPMHGIDYLMAHNEGENHRFFIEESEQVCHANLIFNQPQIDAMGYDFSTSVSDPCVVPKANPKHSELLAELRDFLR